MHAPSTAEETRQIEALQLAVEELRRRIAALEEQSASAALNTGRLPPPAAFPVPRHEVSEVSPGILAALGRLLLGIAGAYLLRAITESGIVPEAAGTMLGLIYGVSWLIWTLRIPAGDRVSVAIHGIAAASIVAPLLWEAAVRFHTLPESVSAAALALFIILGQVFAWKNDHSGLAGITAFAGAATAVALIIGTLNPIPYVLALTAGAVVVEFGASRDRALNCRWITALACDFCMFLLLYLVTRPSGVPEGYAPMPPASVSMILLGLVAIYAGSAATRTLARGTSITWLELLQVAFVAALAAAGWLAISHGAATILVATVCLCFGAACYLVAFAGPLAGRNFHAYATFGLLLVLAGGALMPSGTATLWTALALAAAWSSSRKRGNTLAAHAAFYLPAAGAWSGLIVGYARAVTGVAPTPGHSLSVGSLLYTAATAISYGLLLRTRKEPTLNWIGRIPAAIPAALVCWCFVGVAAGLLLRARIEPPIASTLHTTLIAIVAVALAWLGNRRHLRELIWILFPWMVFGVAKLGIEDFQQNRPITLFMSLLAFGGTLIALPRLLRRANVAPKNV